jgi:DNA-binding NtrC family response regulator
MTGAGQPLMKIEEDYIKLTLEHVRGNRRLAAEMVGISLRTRQNRIAAMLEDAKATTPGSRTRAPGHAISGLNLTGV